jgi:hypothetical protein
MFARCSSCQGKIWIQFVRLIREPHITCGSCGRTYEIQDPSRLGSSPTEHYARATEFGSDHRLDVAGAYSVLLGIMSREQARAARVAELLIKSHGVPLETAARVADGTLSPEKAKRMAAGKRELESHPHREPTTSELQLRIVAAVAGSLAFILFTVFFYAWNAQTALPAVSAPPPLPTPVAERPPDDSARAVPASRRFEPASRRPLGTEVAFDDEGRLVKVSASRPEDVLIVFCAESAPTREPLELASTPIEQQNVWLGVFRDLEDLSRLYAVSIHKDHRTRRWSVGDGARPVRAGPIDTERLGDRRVAARWR